jgi:hypothetical protein
MTELKLNLEVGTGVDANELDELAHQLRQEMLEIGVESVEQTKTIAPTEAKPIDITILNEFLIQFAAGVAASMVMSLWTWLQTQKKQGNDLVKFEWSMGKDRFIIMSTMSKEEAGKLAESFAALVNSK